MERYNLLPKNIFFVDDDLDDCDFFSEALIELNYEAKVKILNDGKTLLDELQKPSEAIPDLIFLDLEMPTMDGITCLSKIRKNNLYANCPIIIWTKSTFDSDINLVFELGASKFITKPYSFRDLKVTIEKVMKDWQKYFSLPLREDFVLRIESSPKLSKSSGKKVNLASLNNR